jgi:hypothetical protein
VSNIISLALARQALPLEIGQVVAYSDRANPRQEAVVVAGGNAYGQTCVFEDGHTSQVRRSYVEGIGGWELVPRILTAPEIVEFCKKAEQAKHDAAIAKADAEIEAAKKAREETERLLREYPHLETTKTSKKRGYALASANIRRLLKPAFPGIEFSVTSKSYSGGNSVSIHWTDGPSTEQVEEIAKRFQGGSFDGMTDCYDYESTTWTDLFGEAKYVQTSRSISDERLREVADGMGYASHEIKWGDLVGVDFETNRAFRRRYQNAVWTESWMPKPQPAPVHAPVLCW